VGVEGGNNPKNTLIISIRRVVAHAEVLVANLPSRDPDERATFWKEIAWIAERLTKIYDDLNNTTDE
jgi:hypothetical protein